MPKNSWASCLVMGPLSRKITVRHLGPEVASVAEPISGAEIRALLVAPTKPMSQSGTWAPASVANFGSGAPGSDQTDVGNCFAVRLSKSQCAGEIVGKEEFIGACHFSHVISPWIRKGRCPWERAELDYVLMTPQPVDATPSDMNSISEVVFMRKETEQAFYGAEDRHVAPLEGWRVVA